MTTNALQSGASNVRWWRPRSTRVSVIPDIVFHSIPMYSGRATFLKVLGLITL